MAVVVERTFVKDGVEQTVAGPTAAVHLLSQGWKEVLEPAAAPVPTVEGAPPKSGAGSSREHWLEYARTHGVTVDIHASRDDIIDAVETHSAPSD